MNYAGRLLFTLRKLRFVQCPLQSGNETGTGGEHLTDQAPPQGRIRPILHVGHPTLRQAALPVPAAEAGSPAIKQLIDDLIATMRAASGAGLAANQIGVPVRVCVIEVKDNPRYPYKPRIPLTVLVNPVITPLSDELFENNEGCLSVPDLRGNVMRHVRIRVEALDRDGGPVDLEVSGLSAGTYQHECDHLDGLLFLDRLTHPGTLATWEQFTLHHRDRYLERVNQLVARFGQ
ncbi:MAG: peptide deformylase [Acidimicrobiales bacterium]|nr:peptide deformylase [Acidimicrobiales bacterium]